MFRSSRPSLISNDLLLENGGEIHTHRRGTIRELHHIIPEVSKTTIHEAVTEKLGHRKFCARRLPKMLTDDHKTKRMGFALVSHALRTGRRYVSGFHCDWR